MSGHAEVSVAIVVVAVSIFTLLCALSLTCPNPRPKPALTPPLVLPKELMTLVYDYGAPLLPAAKVVAVWRGMPPELTRRRPAWVSVDRYGLDSDGHFYQLNRGRDCIECPVTWRSRCSSESESLTRTSRSPIVHGCFLITLQEGVTVISVADREVLRFERSCAWVLPVKSALIVLRLFAGCVSFDCVFPSGLVASTACTCVLDTFRPLLTEAALLLLERRRDPPDGLVFSLADILGGRPLTPGRVHPHLRDWTATWLRPLDIMRVDKRVFVSADTLVSQITCSSKVVFELET